MPPSLNYVQRRESNPRDALLQLYLTERNRAAVIKLNINHRNTNFLINFFNSNIKIFLLLSRCVGISRRLSDNAQHSEFFCSIDHNNSVIDRWRNIPHHYPL